MSGPPPVADREAASGPPPAGAAILVLSEDDDVAGPVESILRREGHRVGVRGAREGLEELRAAVPDLLVLDRDLAPEVLRGVAALLEPRAGRGSFPVLVLGRGKGGEAASGLPAGWHEDASITLGRPPEPGELRSAVAALLRLAFYRPYRDLVHDLSQPVTAIHALVRSVARQQGTPQMRAQQRGASQQGAPPEGIPPPLERLQIEVERLMTLMEEFQRRRAGAAGLRPGGAGRGPGWAGSQPGGTGQRPGGEEPEPGR